jgi:hypothetical protein
MDDAQNDGAGGLEELLAGIEQSGATDEGTTPEADANAETQDQEDEGSETDGEKPEGEEDEDKADEDAPRKKPSGSERAKRRIERLEAELAEARAGRAAAPAGDDDAIKAAVERKVGAPPKESDYPDFLAFERALTAHEVRKAIAEDAVREESARAATTAKAKFAELVDDHEDRLDELEKRLPGSRAKIGKADLPVARHVGELLLESEKSAHLQLHLAERPAKLAELNRMSPVAAAREIGRLEARLSLPTPKTETRAKPPVGAVKGAASPSNHDTELSAWLTKTYGAR